MIKYDIESYDTILYLMIQYIIIWYNDLSYTIPCHMIAHCIVCYNMVSFIVSYEETRCDLTTII